MSTIQITKKWQSGSTKNLVNSDPLKEGKNLSMYSGTQNSNLCAKDLMGLTWVLYDDFEYDILKGTKHTESMCSVG